MKEPIWCRGKEVAGEAAAERIQSGMLVGLGTGSTVAYFLRALGNRCEQGLQITAVASSRQTELIAQELGIPLIEMREISFLDVTVDGADEVDPHYQMIKGGGGALLREKVLASNSGEMLVIIDQGKCKEKLGNCPVPVEVLPFASTAVLTRLERLGYKGQLRKLPDGRNFITDNGNEMIDIDLSSLSQSPREIDKRVRTVVGVLETGFFFDLATTFIIGQEDGGVEVVSVSEGRE